MKGSKEKRRRLTFMPNTDCSLVTLIQASGVLCPHKIHNYSSGLLQLGLPAPASLWKTYVLATGSFCLLCPLIHLLILAYMLLLLLDYKLLPGRNSALYKMSLTKRKELNFVLNTIGWVWQLFPTSIFIPDGSPDNFFFFNFVRKLSNVKVG